MISAPPPENESARIRALRSLEILDTLPEPEFDDIVQLASEICEVPVALMTLIDDRRQWFKSAHGTTVKETPREIAFCAHTILQDHVLVVEDLSTDPRFAQNPLVQSDPRIRFYAGAPLSTSAGLKLGTLCVLDLVPRVLTASQKRALKTLARQIESQLEARRVLRELAHREAEIAAQRDALMRLQWEKQQLTSLIVHDLKTPIANVLPNADHLASDPTLSADGREAAREIGMAADLMLRMVLDLLDIDRSEEGKLAPRYGRFDLCALLVEVRTLARRRVAEHGQSIILAWDDAAPVCMVDADRDLLRRVIDNLIDNALKYGAAQSVIRLSAQLVDADAVEVTVRDEGLGVLDAHKQLIFDRYAQIDTQHRPISRSSRGLGLSFARIAIEAHGGRIWVEDNVPRGATFRIRLPTRVP